MDKSIAQTRDWIATARTLSEALPYLQRYDGATIVIKFGGHAMGDDDAMDEFARDIVLMKQCNVNPVVVHGGGPQINEMLKRLDIRSEFVDGKRVSDAATVEVVEMVLVGADQQAHRPGDQRPGRQGHRALRQGREPDDLRERPETVVRDGVEVTIDLGFVGKPVEVNVDILRSFLGSDFIPVVAPIGGRAGRGDLQRQRRYRRGGDRGGDEGGPAAAPDRRRRGEGRRGRGDDRRCAPRTCAS